jgi:hypothetical protein
VLLLTSLILILGALSFSLLPMKSVRGQAEAMHGKVVLTVTKIDTKELKATVFLDMGIYFKEVPYSDWFLMYLVHTDQDILLEVSQITLNRSQFDDREYQGAGELIFELKPSSMYPFDEYDLTIILYDHESFNETKIASPFITFNLEDELRSSWIEKDKFLNMTDGKKFLGDSRSLVYFSMIISRPPHIIVGLLSPIYLSLIILYLTTFLGTNRRDWLSNRITVYVSLFVFMFTYQSVIQSNAPLRMGISPAELLIYLVATNTVVLFLMSILTSYPWGKGSILFSNVKSQFWSNFLTLDIIGLLIIFIVNTTIFYVTLGNWILQASILSILVVLVSVTPLIASLIETKLRARQFEDIDFLLNYVTIAISEGLVDNTIQGIKYLTNIAGRRIPSYEKEMTELDRVFAFLSDLLIANVNTTYIRDTVLKSYKAIFVIGAERKSVVTYTITAQLRMLSEQITRRENALASRRILLSAYELFETSLNKKYETPTIEDASITYQVISRDVIRQNIFSLFSYNTLLIGLLLLKTVKREELERTSIELLDLMEEYVVISAEFGDPAIIRATRYYVNMYLEKIMPKLKERETLLRRVNALVRRMRSE